MNLLNDDSNLPKGEGGYLCGFCGILYHSITLCFINLDKHSVQGVIDAGFMYHTCVTHLSHPIYVLVIYIVFYCIVSILIIKCQYEMLLYIRVQPFRTSGCTEQQDPGVESRKMEGILDISACFPLFSCLFSQKKYLMLMK